MKKNDIEGLDESGFNKMEIYSLVFEEWVRQGKIDTTDDFFLNQAVRTIVETNEIYGRLEQSFFSFLERHSEWIIGTFLPLYLTDEAQAMVQWYSKVDNDFIYSYDKASEQRANEAQDLEYEQQTGN